MNAPESAQPETETMLGTVSAIMVGLGVITFALFPLLIPGLAVLALFAIPVLPLILVGGLVALIAMLAWRAGGAVARGVRALRTPRRTAPAEPLG
jgi:hypothetical protein